MKKVLIVTYFYPPCNSIASIRPKSYFKYFPKAGLYPIVATRHWTGNEKFVEDMSEPNLAEFSVENDGDGTILRFPYEGKRNKRILALSKTPFIRRLYVASESMLGRFQIGQDSSEFRDQLLKYVRDDPVDAVIAISGPKNVLPLGLEIAKKLDVPFIADLRDIWDNRVLSSSFTPTMNERTQIAAMRYYNRKWLKEASLVSTVTKGMADEIRRLDNSIDPIVIQNGFEKEVFEQAKLKQRYNNRFSISFIGTLYPQQDLSIFFAGIKKFVEQNGPENIQVNFVGATLNKGIGEKLKNNIPDSVLNLKDRMPHEDAVEIMCNSEVLYYAGWKTYKGWASGKIYEYLAAERNILIAPDDHDVINDILTSTNAGVLTDSVEDFVNILQNWFDEWKETGSITYHGDKSKIEFYTRENQSLLLAKAVGQMLERVGSWSS